MTPVTNYDEVAISTIKHNWKLLITDFFLSKEEVMSLIFIRTMINKGYDMEYLSLKLNQYKYSCAEKDYAIRKDTESGDHSYLHKGITFSTEINAENSSIVLSSSKEEFFDVKALFGSHLLGLRSNTVGTTICLYGNFDYMRSATSVDDFAIKLLYTHMISHSMYGMTTSAYSNNNPFSDTLIQDNDLVPFDKEHLKNIQDFKALMDHLTLVMPMDTFLVSNDEPEWFVKPSVTRTIPPIGNRYVPLGIK